MAFKPQEDSEVMSEINVTPLVDVMLVLVIILLVTAPLLTQSVQVTLPETVETTTTDQDQPFQLAIDSKNVITLNKTAYATPAELETALKAEFTKKPDMAVHLYADKTVMYEKVADVMAVVQHAGINKLSFVTVEQ